MKEKTVLILEDDDRQREILHGALRNRGFRVMSARTAAEAQLLVQEFGTCLDVLLLDILLGGSTMNGVEFGLKVKDQLDEVPPEFLIHSAYEDAEYYQLALRLKAATYLRKPTASLADIVRHVRVLALRRSLSPRSPKVLDAIDRIAVESRSSSEAVVRFCREILCPELEASLGTSFMLLVSTSAGIDRFGISLDSPESPSSYDWLQTLTHTRIPTHPLIIDRGVLSDEQVNERLEGAAFIPLVRSSLARSDFARGGEDVRITLGILQHPSQPLAENASELAKLVGAFIQPALVHHLLVLTSSLVGARQRATLEATADFCLQVGQEQVAAFSRAMETGALTHSQLSPDLEKVLILSERLRKAGELLTWICRPRERNPSTGELRLSSVAKLISEAWQDLLLEMTSLDPDLLTIEGDCWVSGSSDDLQIAVSRILRWLSWRAVETPAGVTPGLSVSCRSIPDKCESHIVFEDRSQRLPKMLRSRVFSTLVPPLLGESEAHAGRGEILDPYIAKMLIEIEGGGSMEDRSDELEGDLGHRLVVCLPESPPSDTSSLR